MTADLAVLAAVRDGVVFYDYFNRQHVQQHEPGKVTDVSMAVQALEDSGLIEYGSDTGGDWQPTAAGRAELAATR